MKLAEQMTACIHASTEWNRARAAAAFGNDSPEARKIKRRFKINAAAAYIGVSRQAIESAEKEGRLPPADYIDSKGENPRPVRAGYTLEQIDSMRDVFGKQPYRPEGSEAVVFAVTGGKGGCYKTSTAANYAQWLSLRGYRVLVVDMDPQAHLSMYFGYHPELNTTINDTVLPYLLGDEDDLTYCVKATAWPKLDIIPGHLHMQRLERELPEADIEYAPHQMLQAGLQTISDNYDIIILDGHPDLGMGTLNMICASTVTLMATSTEVNDINSTSQLMSLVRDIYDENSMMETTHEPIVRVLPTKLNGPKSSSYKNLEDMHRFWPGLPLLNGIRVTDEIGKGQRRMASIYEQAEEQRSSPAAWKRANDIYEACFSEMLDSLVKPVWGQ